MASPGTLMLLHGLKNDMHHNGILAIILSESDPKGGRHAVQPLDEGDTKFINTDPAQKMKPKTLLEACNSGDLLAVQESLDSGSDPNKASKKGNTPLKFACRSGDLEMTTLLLEYGADIDKLDKQCLSAIDHACLQGHDEVVEMLVWHGATIELSAVFVDAFDKQATEEAAAKKKAASKADKKAKQLANQALIKACHKGDLLAVQECLDSGSDPNKAPKKGNTLLKLACRKGHLKIASLLLEYGADIDKLDKQGLSAIDHACLQGHDEVVEMLVQHGDTIELSAAFVRKRKRAGQEQGNAHKKPNPNQVKAEPMPHRVGERVQETPKLQAKLKVTFKVKDEPQVKAEPAQIQQA